MFVNANDGCNKDTVSIATMNYSVSEGKWIVPNSLLSPLMLVEGVHY
jgi:hypothetical protein